MWKEAEQYLKKDKYLALLVAKWGHCTISPKLHIDFYQALVGDIIGQQLSGRVADVIEGRLKDKINERLSPDKILALSENDLRSCGMAWAKVRAIRDLSLRVKNKQLHIKKLKELTENTVKNELVAVKGIGSWTADMFLMFTLGRPDIFPTEDLGIKKGFEKVTGKKWDKVESPAFAEKHWKPFRTVASWYLWRSLESK